jgi:6-phosphogluconolactonase
MSATEVQVFDNPELLARATAEELTSMVRAKARDNGHFSLAISGGHTPLRLFELLADPQQPWNAALPWEQLSIFWVDERWVPHSDPESNFGVAYTGLFSRFERPGPGLHPFDTSLESPLAAAEAMQAQIREHFGLKGKAELPRFDLVLLGLGADGHTASLFPGSQLEFAPGQMAAAVHVPKLDSWRLTLTPALINEAREAIFLVSGEDKTQALRAVVTAEGPQAPPAALIRLRDGRLRFWADREAAGK